MRHTVKLVGSGHLFEMGFWKTDDVYANLGLLWIICSCHSRCWSKYSPIIYRLLYFFIGCCRIVMGSEKELVESYTKLLCLDGDLDLLYGLLEKTQTLLTKAKAKELIKYTTNLDTNLRKSIALQRSSLFQDEKMEIKVDVPHVEADGVPSSFTASDTQSFDQRPHIKPMKIQLTEKRELPMPAGEVIRLRKRKIKAS